MKRLVIFLVFIAAIIASPMFAELAAKAVAVYTVAPKYGRNLPEGRGWFGLRLDPTGRVLAARVVTSTGHHELDSSAIAALKQWRFKPGSSNYIVMPVSFTHDRGRGMSVNY